jgi:hypothetical protein
MLGRFRPGASRPAGNTDFRMRLLIHLFLTGLLMGQGVALVFANPEGSTYSLSKNDYVPVASKKARLPLYVYESEPSQLSDFVASGYMGDTTSLKAVRSTYDTAAPLPGMRGRTSMRIEYQPTGRQGWAGIYWQTPANNWGKMKGAGFDLSKARYLSFWVRGEKGGEVLASVKVGGITGPYPDSAVVSMGPIRLKKEWQRYKLDLANQDLRHIIGGFMFILRRADNPRGATIYFDEIVFVGEEDIEYVLDDARHPVAKKKLARRASDEEPVVKEAQESAASSVAPVVKTEPAPIPTPEVKTVVVQAPPKIIYVEKQVPAPAPLQDVAAPPQVELQVRYEAYRPTPQDFYFELIRRAMNIQPAVYAYGYPLYKWAKYLQETMVAREVSYIPEGRL